MATDAERIDGVLDVATTAFLRHGFKRVTMGDIAAAAGMSRPALYLLFPNKEAIFNAALERFTGAALAEIEAGLGARGTIADKLAFALEVWTVRPYLLLSESPDAKALVDCSYGFANDTVERGYRTFEALLTGLFAPYAARLAQHALRPEGLARVFALSARGIKEGAGDAAALRALVADLVTMTVALLGDAPAARRGGARATTAQ